MEFLQNKIFKKILPSPKVYTSPCGVSKSKLENLKNIIPPNKLEIWKNLEEENEYKK